MLEKEFQYYLNNQEELLKKYQGRHLVIKGQKVIGSYDSEAQAYLETKKEHEPGTFLIQLCTPGEKDYTLTFYNDVVFS